MTPTPKTTLELMVTGNVTITGKGTCSFKSKWFSEADYQKLEAEHFKKLSLRCEKCTWKNDVEKLEAENQQLKDEVACLENENNYAKGVVCYYCNKCRVPQLEKQIADANKILDDFWKEYLEGSYDEVKLVKNLRSVLHSKNEKEFWIWHENKYPKKEEKTL